MYAEMLRRLIIIAAIACVAWRALRDSSVPRAQRSAPTLQKYRCHATGLLPARPLASRALLAMETSSQSEELTSSSDATHSSTEDLDTSSEIDSQDGSSTSRSGGDVQTPRGPRASSPAPAALPRLALPVPRLGIPPAGLGGDAGASKTPDVVAAAAPQVAVELLSPAFEIAPRGAQVGDVQGQCASKLGVRQDRVRLYALVELRSIEETPPGCQRVAVEVQGSGEREGAAVVWFVLCWGRGLFTLFPLYHAVLFCMSRVLTSSIFFAPPPYCSLFSASYGGDFIGECAAVGGDARCAGPRQWHFRG